MSENYLMSTNDETEESFIQILFKNVIQNGTFVKIFQFEKYAKDRCNDVINFKNILETHLFKKNITTNCILINIEKDTKRYHSAVDEFSKLELETFVHLIATYWKEREKFVNDMNIVLDFLKQFNPKISLEKTEMNIFSEFNDKNIYIQDGPLACYCSHVRAMMYGYLNFKDYTIICEDDLLVANTNKIEQYIKQIPEDWDIICLNSIPLNAIYTEPYYKFTNTFHSLHFYIIKNKCLPTIFENIYPIFDQIDIIIANLHDRLNIYNIVETVYQKNFSSNTQNNLYVVFNSPNYELIRVYLKEMKDLLYDFVNKKLTDNDPTINRIIASNIIFDVIYDYIINNINNTQNSAQISETPIINNDEIEHMIKDNQRLYETIYIIINCAVKGIRVKNRAYDLYIMMNTILDCFKLHNTLAADYNERLKALSYGSTSNIYKIQNHNVVIKVYNEQLRWSIDGHNNANEIFNKELEILKKLQGVPNVPQLIQYDEPTQAITMSYLGTSLYNDFSLPTDWKNQISDIFSVLTENGIVYHEFNLKNIVVLDDKLAFIDFGLATFEKNTTNEHNCKIFIELLEILDTKFKETEFKDVADTTDITEQKQLLYITFINNLKINQQYSGIIF